MYCTFYYVSIILNVFLDKHDLQWDSYVEAKMAKHVVKIKVLLSSQLWNNNIMCNDKNGQEKSLKVHC